MNTAKWFRSVGLAGILLCISASSAFADFQVAGTSSGAFYQGSNNFGPSVLGLTFTGGPFGPGPSPIALGSFAFTNPPLLPSSLNPYDFVLRLNFTSPGTGSSSFSADVKGAVGFGLGVATINFDPNTEHITYSNAQGSGSFDLTLNDLLVYSGSRATIIGNVTNATFAPAPEPESILLISTLLGGALLFRRRLGQRA